MNCWRCSILHKQILPALSVSVEGNSAFRLPCFTEIFIPLSAFSILNSLTRCYSTPTPFHKHTLPELSSRFSPLSGLSQPMTRMTSSPVIVLFRYLDSDHFLSLFLSLPPLYIPNDVKDGRSPTSPSLYIVFFCSHSSLILFDAPEGMAPSHHISHLHSSRFTFSPYSLLFYSIQSQRGPLWYHLGGHGRKKLCPWLGI